MLGHPGHRSAVDKSAEVSRSVANGPRGVSHAMHQVSAALAVARTGRVFVAHANARVALEFAVTAQWIAVHPCQLNGLNFIHIRNCVASGTGVTSGEPNPVSLVFVMG